MHPRASMLLQYAIQGYLQTCINWFMHNISSVLLGKQFEGIDRRIRKSESQVTYGRWRALTYYYAQEGIKSGQEEFSKVVLDDAPSDIIALGQFMTEHPPNKDHVKEVTEDTISAFTRILENVHRLAIVMRQNIISSNFRLYLPSPDDTFHSRKHDLPAPLPKVEGRDRIIVTLRIGTQKEEKVGRDGIEGAKTEYHIHDRPQVVTVRLLQELLSQNTGSPTRRRQTTRPTKDEITMAVTPKGG
ncbi:hypothetical protein FRC03_002644 [Tulasnella sp. 419]|nr:hypothetical protein FRC03_002644 [Tulasnella sp. 419]